MTISIIIAVKTWGGNLKECVDNSLRLSCRDLEIIIAPDEAFDNIACDNRIKVIPTGNVSPPLKRDIAAREAKGKIIAFLDDDAYPAGLWAEAALKLFEDKSVACVCGPAVTPLSDSLLQKASGLVYESFLVSGAHGFRYLPAKERHVDDFPSCNFLVRKNVFESVGGFNTKFWPGEDTFLCDKITAIGGKMLYHPDVLVYHHRRRLFSGHLKQIKNYALHRGYFAKKFGASSLKSSYFIPSLFDLFLVFGGVLAGMGIGSSFYFALLVFYCACVFFACVSVTRRGNNALLLFPLVFAGTVATHITYGIYFIAGLLAKRMPEE